MVKPSYSFSVLSTGGLSDEGYAHKKNEDAWDVFELQSGAGAITVGIVADGVTSKAGGATASGLATTTIRQTMQEAAPRIFDPSMLQEVIDDAVHKANRAILDEARKHPEIGNMSTTLVLAAVGWGQLQIAYLGDSRAYLLRNGQLHRLTLDHTWAQEAVDKGLIELEELKTHPNRNVIRRFLGINRQIDIDRQILKPGHYQRNYLSRDYTRALQLNQHDLLLLCSDGLTERTNDDEIASILTRRLSQPEQAVDDLIQLALSREEQDNITAVVLSLNEERHDSSIIKIFAWSAVLVAILAVAMLGYTVLRQTTVVDSAAAALVENSDVVAVSSETHSPKPEELGLATNDVLTGKQGSDQDNSAEQSSTQAGQIKPNTVPYAQTKVAKTALAQTALAQVSTPTASSSDATGTPSIDITATSVPTASISKTSIVTVAQTTTSTQDLLTDILPGADDTASVHQTQLALAPTERSSLVPIAEDQASVDLTNRLGTTHAPDLTNTPVQKDAPVQDAPVQDAPVQEEVGSQRIAAVTVNSTPTRKALPTPKPTSTPTSTTTPEPPAQPTAASDSSDGDLLSGGAQSRVIAILTPEPATDTPSNVRANGDRANSGFGNQLTFVLPPDRETIRAGNPVIFQWITDYELSATQTFEVVIWQPARNGEGKKAPLDDGMGMVDIKNSPPTRIDATTWSLQTSPPRNFQAGEYSWSVIVVEIEPQYKRVYQLSKDTRKFILTKDSRGGSRSSGKTEDSSGESASGGCSGAACGDR